MDVRILRLARRPLVALVALVAALAVGYGLQAAGSGHIHAPVRSSTAR
jgi:hypothetical protein